MEQNKGTKKNKRNKEIRARFAQSFHGKMIFFIIRICR